MGLFDVFSRKDEQSRQELLDLLERQYGEARAAHDTAMRTALARRESAQGWLKANRAAISDDYTHLVDAFLTMDADAVRDTLRALGDRAGVVLSIPVYMADGVTAVSFSQLADKVFAGQASVTYALRNAQLGVPESAYSAASAASGKLPVSPGGRPDSPSEAGLFNRLSGAHKQAQKDRIAELSAALDALKSGGPQTLDNVGKETDKIVAREVALIADTASRRYAFLQSFTAQSADGVVNGLAALSEKGLRDEILAAGTARADVADFTTLALQSFTDPDDAARVYSALLAIGQPVQPLLVLDRALAVENPLPVTAVSEMLAAVENTGGMTALHPVLTAADAAGVPYMARALKVDGLLTALLAPVKSEMVRAFMLQSAATATTDAATAAALRAEAEKRGGKDYINLGAFNRVRLSAIEWAMADGDKLKYAINGTVWHDTLGKAEALAAVGYIAQQKGFHGLDNMLAVNTPLVLNAWVSNREKAIPQLNITTANGTLPVALPAEAADALTAKLAALPGWARVGAEVVNTAHLDNVWAVPGGNDSATVKMRGAGRGYYAETDAAGAAGMVDALAARGDTFVRAGAEVFNLRRAGNVWLEGDKDSTVIKFSFGGGETLHAALTPAEGAAALKALARGHGYLPVSDKEAINPRRLDFLALEAAGPRGNAGILRYNIDGAAHSSEFARIDDAVAVHTAAAKGSRAYERVSTTLSVNTAQAEGFYTADGKTHSVAFGAARDLGMDAEDGAGWIAAQARKRGFVMLGGAAAVNPRLAHMAYYKDGELHTVAGKWRHSVAMSETDAAIAIDDIIEAAGDDMDGRTAGMDAGPVIDTAPPAEGLSAAFNRTAAPEHTDAVAKPQKSSGRKTPGRGGRRPPTLG